MSQFMFGLVVLIAGLLVVGSNAATNNIIRVSLGKKVNRQAGDLGQPVTSYYANINIGTPPKPFKFLIDINAREIWIPHKSLIGRILGRLNYKDGYAKKDSTTGFKEEGEAYTISYKDIELAGKAYKDVYQFKDVTESLSPVCYEQRFLAISSASSDKFTQYGVDGVMAMNPWPISATGSDLIRVGLMRAQLIGDLKFALALNEDENSTDGGELTFGGVNPKKYTGSLRFHPVLSQHSWQLGLQGVMLGANLLDCGDSHEPCRAMLSTSTNDIHGPSASIRGILKLLGFEDIDEKFNKKKLYEIDCRKVATAPSLKFIIDNTNYTLPPSSYIKLKESGLIFKSQSCYVALIPNDSTNFWELGTYFIENYYAVFDTNHSQVALATRSS